jgi:DeoR/GlpR family transcriptional regulator of sugar metabolism
MATTESDELEPILRLFQIATQITISDVVENLKISRTTAGRRLNILIKAGKIHKVGRGRAASYVLHPR